MEASGRLRVLVVDDHPIFRHGLVSILSDRKDLQVVGEAGDGNQAIAMARARLPELILMDICMPNCNGLDAVRAIKKELPQIRIVMMSASDHDDDLYAAIKGGAEGYLLKNLEPPELFFYLDAVRRGEAALSPYLAARILAEMQSGTPWAPHTKEIANPRPSGQTETHLRNSKVSSENEIDPRGDTLTPRDIDVLEHVVLGENNQEIARALCISENTVKMHMRNILEKLHLQNRIQAAVLAVRQKLVTDPSESP